MLQELVTQSLATCALHSAMTGKPYGTTLDYKDYAALERNLKGHCLPECLASHLFRSPAKGGTIHIEVFKVARPFYLQMQAKNQLYKNQNIASHLRLPISSVDGAISYSVFTLNPPKPDHGHGHGFGGNDHDHRHHQQQTPIHHSPGISPRGGGSRHRA